MTPGSPLTPPDPFARPGARAPKPKPGEKPEEYAARVSRFTREQQVIERGIEEVLGDLGSVIADAEIKAAIRMAISPSDLHDRLVALLEDASSPEFQQTFERALFAADVLGYVHSEERPQA